MIGPAPSSTLRKRRLKTISRLYANILCPQIVLSILDIIVYKLGALHKYAFYALACLRASLEVDQIVLLGEVLSFLCAHLPLQFEVAFVRDKKDYHFGVGVFAHVFKPFDEVVEGLTASDVVNEEGADTPPIIAACYRTKTLLPCRVPYLYLNISAIVKLYGFGTKVHTDCEIVRVLEAVVDVLEEEAGLSHATFSHDYELKNVLIAHYAITFTLHFIN